MIQNSRDAIATLEGVRSSRKVFVKTPRPGT